MAVVFSGQSVFMVCSTLGNLIWVLRTPSETLSLFPVPRASFPNYDACYYCCNCRGAGRERSEGNWEGEVYLPRCWEPEVEEWRRVPLTQHQDPSTYEGEATWALLSDTLEVGMAATYWRDSHAGITRKSIWFHHCSSWAWHEAKHCPSFYWMS